MPDLYNLPASDFNNLSQLVGSLTSSHAAGPSPGSPTYNQSGLGSPVANLALAGLVGGQDTIGGQVVNSGNNNGLAGWTVYLSDRADSTGPTAGEATTTTDANGYFHFLVAPGTYYVHVVAAPGWTSSGSSPSTPIAFNTDGDQTQTTASFQFQTTAPTVTLSSMVVSQNKLNAIPVTATFSIPVSGLTTGNITVANATVSNLNPTSGLATTWTFDLTPTALGQDVTASINANAATGLNGLGNSTSNLLTVLFPASIAVQTGGTRSATVNTAFGINLAAKVEDQNGTPVPGITVTFTAPGSGASGIFTGGTNTITETTTSGGIATAPTFTANTIAGGPYTVTAAVTGVSPSANFSLTNNPGVPAAPTGLKALSGNAQVSLTWNASAGAANYDVYRGTTTGGESATPIATGITNTTFTNTGLTIGTTYFYVVTAVNVSGQSGHSNEASASPNFTDTFHRANSSNLGSNWTTVLGTMGISSNMAVGLPTPSLSYVVDLAQVNNLSLTNAAASALVNVGTTGERYAGVFARRDAAGDMYVAMLGVNTTGTPHNPAGTPTAALFFRFTPGLAGTINGGWSFLVYKLLPTPPNTGSANLGLDVTGTGLATTLHLYLNGVLTLTFVESQAVAIGVSQHPLNNAGGVGLLSVDAGTTYGNFIAGLPGWVPQAQELAETPKSPLGVSSLTAEELAPIVTAAEARWESAGLSAPEVSQLQGLQFVITSLSPGLLGEYVPGVIYLDAIADGWGWFVDPTPGQDEEYAAKAGALAALPGSGAAGHVDLLTVVMHEMGHALGLPDITAPGSTDLMAEALATGLRRLPSMADIDAAFASQA